jgi:glycosyltransferase involved in cell wall biosynthesis
MRVLFITTSYPTEAAPVAGVFVKEHARAAAEHAEVAVLHLDRSHDHRGLPRLSRVEREDFPTWRVAYPWSPMPASAVAHFAAAARGWRAVRRSGFDPDVIHAHFFLAGVPAVLLGRFTHTPVVVTEQWSVFLPDDPMELTRPLRASARFAYERADLVLPASDALRRGIESYGIHARFEVLPNVVDTSLFGEANGDTRNGRLLAVGLLYEAKGYEYLLEAIELLRREGRDIELDIVGDGPERTAYTRLANELGLNGHVVFHGIVPKPEVARRMREASLFVLTSRYDNNPCVLIEAMASGLPVVATAVGGIPEVVDESSGILARPRDPRSIADGIAAALDRPGGWDHRQIANSAAMRFGRDEIGRRLAEIYERVAR